MAYSVNDGIKQANPLLMLANRHFRRLLGREGEKRGIRVVGGTEIQNSSVTGIVPKIRSILAPRPLHCCILGKSFGYSSHDL